MTATDETLARELAAKVIAFLETGTPPEGLFTAEAFCDFTMPQWRLQAQGIEHIVRLRKGGHPSPGRVPRSRFDLTAQNIVHAVPGLVERQNGVGACGLCVPPSISKWRLRLRRWPEPR